MCHHCLAYRALLRVVIILKPIPPCPFGLAILLRFTRGSSYSPHHLPRRSELSWLQYAHRWSLGVENTPEHMKVWPEPQLLSESPYHFFFVDIKKNHQNIRFPQLFIKTYIFTIVNFGKIWIYTMFLNYFFKNTLKIRVFQTQFSTWFLFFRKINFLKDLKNINKEN